MVKEANIISKELNREVDFSAKLVTIWPEGISNPLEQLKKCTNDIRIEVNNKENNL